jgi:hypothetical protein
MFTDCTTKVVSRGFGALETGTRGSSLISDERPASLSAYSLLLKFRLSLPPNQAGPTSSSRLSEELNRPSNLCAILS